MSAISPASGTWQLELRIVPEDSSAEELDDLTRRLKGELNDTMVGEAAIAASGTLPAGAKAVDPVTLGVLAVAVLPTLLPKLVEFLDHWLQRQQSPNLKLKVVRGDRSIELEVTGRGSSSQELASLVSKLEQSIS